MPFCPSCGYEYEEGIEKCPDCEVKLVDHLSEEHFKGEMVEVYSTNSTAEAGMVKELLYGEGIFSALSNELGSGVFGGTGSELGEVKVFVSGEDEDHARELIKAYMEDNPLEEEESNFCQHCGSKVEPGEETCPFCGESVEEE